MKKQIIMNFFIVFSILVCFIFVLTGCSSDDTNLQAKTEKEIEHLEEKIIAIMNSLNQITLSNSMLIEEKPQSDSQDSQKSENKQESGSSESGGESQSKEKSEGESAKSSGDNSSSSSNESNNSNTSSEEKKYEVKNDSILANKNSSLDWKSIKSSVETIHSEWATLTIDLHALNVNNEDILNFSDVLDQVTISIKQEDKTTTLNNLASLYAYFPNYIKQILDDNEKINLNYTKTCILNSYALVEQEKWEEMKSQVSNAIQYFTNILNGVNENTKNQNRISKIYVMLNELNNSIDIKDKDLYMIKYKNVMEELVNF